MALFALLYIRQKRNKDKKREGFPLYKKSDLLFRSFCREEGSELLIVTLFVKSNGASCSLLLFLKERKKYKERRAKVQMPNPDFSTCNCILK